MRTIAAALILAVAALASPSAQAPTMDVVLARAAKYVADYQKNLQGIVAEESYAQNVMTNRANGPGARVRLNREGRYLKSDLLLVKLGDEDQWLQFRDVYEVDRQPVRDRDRRLYKLFVSKDPNAKSMAKQIQEESARYNIGPIVRTINIPMLGLLFFELGVQNRMEFTQGAAGNVKKLEELAPAGQIWMIEFKEVGKGTMVQGENSRDLPSHGRAWIDSSTGRILRTEVITEDTQLRAVIDVTYKADDAVPFLVPAEMRETYNVRSTDTRIDGRATYAKFRQFKVTTDEKTEKPKGGW
jgi:hypothetical protein